MTRITSSNGVDVRTSADGRIETHGAKSSGWSTVQPRLAQALREFFQAEADERLGRWRWPEDPNLVVYRTEFPDIVRVMHEPNGQGMSYERNEYPDHTTGYSGAGNAYFDAHPEPKPWHDAKPCEVWVLTHVKDETSAFIVDGNRFESGSWSLPFDAPSITAGRRIWPEVSS